MNINEKIINQDIEREIEKDLLIFNQFMESLKIKIGYKNDFYFLCDLFNRNLIEKIEVNALQIKEMWLDYIKNVEKDHTFQLYIGIPYCYSKCAYCIYHMGVAKDKELEEYAKKLINSIIFFQDVLRKIKFNCCYFGGGTPSLLEEQDLFEIMKIISKSTQFVEGAEKTFECNPQSTTYEKLKIAKEFGFNRVSFGVQSFSRDVLNKINRGYQTKEMVRNCIDWSKRLEFQEIAIDLIIGLYGDSEETFLESFNKAVELKPNKIYLYICQPPKEYLRFYFDNSWEKYNKHFKTLTKKLPEIYKIAEEADYIREDKLKFIDPTQVGAILFNLRTSPIIKHCYTGMQITEKISVFGLGHHVNSCIYETAIYHSTPLEIDPEKNIYNLTMFSKKEQMQFFILNSLENYPRYYIDKIKFRKLFGIELEKVFEDAILKLKILKKIQITHDKIFYLPKENKEKFLYALFFIGRDKIVESLKNYAKPSIFF